MWLRRFRDLFVPSGRKREARRARRMLSELFRSPEVLRGSSLRPAHRSRAVYLGHETQEGRIVRISFGILRHPRPLRYSSHSHEVIEYYLYDLLEQSVKVVRSVNVTRLRQTDDASS